MVLRGTQGVNQEWANEAVDSRYVDWSVATAIIYLPGTEPMVDKLMISNLTCEAHARGVRLIVNTPGFQQGAPGNMQQLANATARSEFTDYVTAYVKSQGIDGVLPDIEGFQGPASPSPHNASSPNWYANATMTRFMKEIKAAIGPSRVLMFPVQTNYWDCSDDSGGGLDYTDMAEATDSLFLMACE